MFKSLLISALCAGCAWAQGEMRENMVYFSVMTSPSPVPGAPYSAQARTERVQTLADGNRIVQTTTMSVARDSQGRTRNESVLSGFAPPGRTAPHLATISDPIAGYTFSLDPDNKTAFKLPMGKGDPLADAKMKMDFAQTELGPGPGKVRIVSRSGFFEKSGSEGSPAKTDLGTETMEGVLVQGIRLTKTIPAGSIGNEQPIVITTETWTSPDLKVLVMSKSSDPRIGETTYKLTNIQRSEPPASLFQVPPDYTIKDGPPKELFIQKAP